MEEEEDEEEEVGKGETMRKEAQESKFWHEAEVRSTKAKRHARHSHTNATTPPRVFHH